MKRLEPVIKVDDKKCINCHACISACPVKFCIDGSGDHVAIQPELCIGCGSCISACTHEARSGLDDFDAFMEALKRGEKVVAISAPAVASSFPGEHLRLNGFLLSLGVKAVFDVSFGAELTVKSYIEHLKAASPAMVVAQPCPALVTFMEIYAPSLLPHLAPADSPMMHTMKMIRRWYKEYADHRIAVVSPCYAKKREFDEVGMGDFNVTIKSLSALLKGSGRSLAEYPVVEYANPSAERAVLFSSPGGLMRTVERESPETARKVRKIEGPEAIYPYLSKLSGMLEKGMNPLLVDCLNCQMGCNGGPGTLNHGKSPDEVEYPVEKRSQEMERRYGAGRDGGRGMMSRRGTMSRRGGSGASKARGASARVNKVLSKFWEKGLYARSYVDRSSSFVLRRPTPGEVQEIERRMLKFAPEDRLNCASCGYGSCDDMVVAIHNGLNKPENCHLYRQKRIEKEHGQIADLTRALDGEIRKVGEEVTGVRGMIGKVSARNLDQSTSLEESSASIQEMIASINNSSRVSKEKQRAVEKLVTDARRGEEDMRRTVESMGQISRAVEGIWEMIEVINDVADKTNLLSMNAAIEAAHAGNAGRGFAVVAAEIRKLAETTAENARRISSTLKATAEGITSTADITRSTGTVIHGMIQDIDGVASSITELIDSLHEMSVGSTEITTALAALRDMSTEVRESYGKMEGAAGEVESTMSRIGSLSKENLERIGGNGDPAS